MPLDFRKPPALLTLARSGELDKFDAMIAKAPTLKSRFDFWKNSQSSAWLLGPRKRFAINGLPDHSVSLRDMTREAQVACE